MTWHLQLSNILFGEEYHSNLMYGHVHIFKKYTNVKFPYRMPGPLTHGHHLGCGIHGNLSEHDKEEKQKTYFVWNKRNLERCREHGYINVTAIGAPFLYLPSISFSEHPTAHGYKSLLLFPDHSSEFEPFINPVNVYRAYLEEIEPLLTFFEKVTVCLYWVEYQNKEIINLFERKQIQVVTLGHRDHNLHFLTHFRNLVNQYSYVSTNRICSALLYSLYMRKKAFIFGTPSGPDTRNHLLWTGREFPDSTLVSNSYPELFWKDFDHRSHFRIGEKELGLEFKKSPEKLRKIFGWTPAHFLRMGIKRGFFYITRRLKKFLRKR